MFLSWNLLFGNIAVIAGLANLWLSAYLVHHWRNIQARSLFFLLMGTVVWSCAYGGQLLCPDFAVKLLWVKIKSLGFVTIPVLLFHFVLVTTNYYTSAHRRVMYFLWLWAALVITATLTNHIHHLVWADARLIYLPGLVSISFERGWFFSIYLAWAYALLTASIIYLIRYSTSSNPIQRKQGALMLGAIFAPWLINSFFFFGPEAMTYIELTPISFIISSLCFVLALFRYHLLRLIPLAREAVMDGLGDPVIVLDMQDRIAKVNRACVQALCLKHFPEERTLLSSFSPQIYQLVCKSRGNTAREFDVTMALTAHPINTKSTRHWHVRIAPLRSPHQVQSGWLVVLRDITHQKEGENALRGAKNFVKNIINSMPCSIIAVDRDFEITHWNHGAHVLTGTPAHRASGQNLTSLLEDITSLYKDFSRAMETGRIQRREKQELSINNRDLIVDIITFPLTSITTPGAVIQINDITEQTRVREMMIQSEKMMSVGGLAAGLAHEINNPLAGMIQSLQVIKNRLSNPLPANLEAARKHGIPFDRLVQYMEDRKLLYMMDLAEDAGLRAAKVVDNMLSFSRSQTGEKSCHSLFDIVDSTISLLQNDYSAGGSQRFKSIEMKTMVLDDLPAVPCEKSMIQQVVLNILKNGAQAMENHTDPDKAPPQFIFRFFMDKEMACVEIQDNGPGIPEHIRRRIFEPFFTTKPVGKGTGLGLSVSYFIVVDTHKGKLTVNSSPGKGTAFTIKLPALPCTDSPAQA